MTNLEALARQLERSDDYRVLRRLRVPTGIAGLKGRTRVAAVLDVETTGLDSAQAKIIQLAIIRFEYSLNGSLQRVLDTYEALEDPGKPIPAEVTALTGITDEMVAGQRLDDAEVRSRLQSSDLILAHNAGFDRPFVERRFPGLRDKPWACTIEDIPWREEGFGSRSLDYLVYRYGFFFDAHQAQADCLAVVMLLSRTLPRSGRGVLQTLLERARRETIQLWAVDSPFSLKDQLRARGYRWNNGEDGRPKAWFLEVGEERLEDEVDYLQSLGLTPQQLRLDATDRYREAPDPKGSPDPRGEAR